MWNLEMRSNNQKINQPLDSALVFKIFTINYLAKNI